MFNEKNMHEFMYEKKYYNYFTLTNQITLKTQKWQNRIKTSKYVKKKISYFTSWLSETNLQLT